VDGTLITGTLLVDGSSSRPGTLRTEGERIAEILPKELSDGETADLAARHGCDVVDGSGLWLIPGGVDPHVHFGLRAGKISTSDDFLSGTRAALAGGTTTVLDFITPARGESLAAAAANRMTEAAHAACDFALHAGVTEWREGMADELSACIAEFGLRSVKLYMAYLETIGLERGALETAMRTAAALDLTVLVHCEDGARISALQQDLLAGGQHGVSAHPRSRPPACEEIAVAEALNLAAKTGCRPYLVHLSTAGAITAVREARRRGLIVLAETCPQYLLFDESVYAGAFHDAAPYVMSPPLRPAEHRKAVCAGLSEGILDIVATDHCAFDLTGQKELGRNDFTRIPGGAAGVEHRLPLLFTLGVQGGLISASDWVRLVSTRPAEVFGLAPRKGTLSAGSDADLVLWDPHASRTIRASDANTRCDHTIYEGMTVRGCAARVWLRGRTVFEDGALCAPSGKGTFLLASSSSRS
jgi:dihydropyrimidinase